MREKRVETVQVEAGQDIVLLELRERDLLEMREGAMKEGKGTCGSRLPVVNSAHQAWREVKEVGVLRRLWRWSLLRGSRSQVDTEGTPQERNLIEVSQSIVE